MCRNQQDNQSIHPHPSYAPSMLNMDVESDTTPQGPTPRVSDQADRTEPTTDEFSSRLARGINEQVEKALREIAKELSSDLKKQLENHRKMRQDTLDGVTGDMLRLERSFSRLSGDVGHILHE